MENVVLLKEGFVEMALRKRDTRNMACCAAAGFDDTIIIIEV
jgi:hypothetical protein